MPRPGRKRTRSQVDSGLDRRNARGRDDEDDEAGDSTAAATPNEVEMGQEDDGDGEGDVDMDPSQPRRQKQRAWRLPDGYDDRNRAFLQALLAHGAFTFQQARPLLAAILNAERRGARGGGGEGETQGGDDEEVRDVTPDDITLDDLREFVGMAQRVLHPLEFEIRSAVDQRTGGGEASRLWALVSTDRDPKSHLPVLFTPRKLAFVHRLLEALFDTYNTPRIEALCLTEQQALKLSRPPRTAGARASTGAEGSSANANRDKGLKHSVVLGLLQSLVRQGWLDKSPSGFYSLSTRALLELEPFLVETFNDPDAGAGVGARGEWQRVKYCAACRELVTVGLRCATPLCTLRLHDHCEASFWRTQVGGGQSSAGGGGRRKCPRCQAAWGKVEGADGEAEGELHFVGERAITTTDVYRRKKRQGRPSEGVDELMRTLLPKTVPAARLPVRQGQASSSSRAGRTSQANGNHEEEDDDEGDESLLRDE